MMSLTRMHRIWTAPDRLDPALDCFYYKASAALRRVARAIASESMYDEEVWDLQDCLMRRYHNNSVLQARLNAARNRALALYDGVLAQLGGVLRPVHTHARATTGGDSMWLVECYENVWFTLPEIDGGSYSECETGHVSEVYFMDKESAERWHELNQKVWYADGDYEFCEPRLVEVLR